MPFFDFLRKNPRYAGKDLSLNRLNRRHQFLIDPFRSDLTGARVLDLASHDGRWSYALSEAGAAEVVGVEARADQIAQFDSYPDGPVKERVSFVHGDVYEEIPRMATAGERFDVVAVFGLYYHVMDHYGLLTRIQQLRPRLVIIDSEFTTSTEASIRLVTEPTASRLNSIAHVAGQATAPVGIPSRSALELMAGSLGYEVEWSNWNALPPSQRGGLKSYYRTPPEWKIRDTCALRPAVAASTP